MAAPESSQHPNVTSRIARFRAASRSARDGLVSTSAIVVGVAAADPAPRTIFVAGAAGLLAGAMSIAVGEYLAVAARTRERRARPKVEVSELSEEARLALMYQERGLSAVTSQQVAHELMAAAERDPQTRLDLGLDEAEPGAPMSSALFCGAVFAGAAAVPLLAAMLAPEASRIVMVALVTLLALAGLVLISEDRMRTGFYGVFWGSLAMAATYSVGALFGVTV